MTEYEAKSEAIKYVKAMRQRIGISEKSYVIKTGRRYAKIIEVDTDGSMSAVAFLERATRFVWQATSWTTPSKRLIAVVGQEAA